MNDVEPNMVFVKGTQNTIQVDCRRKICDIYQQHYKKYFPLLRIRYDRTKVMKDKQTNYGLAGLDANLFIMSRLSWQDFGYMNAMTTQFENPRDFFKGRKARTSTAGGTLFEVTFKEWESVVQCVDLDDYDPNYGVGTDYCKIVDALVGSTEYAGYYPIIPGVKLANAVYQKPQKLRVRPRKFSTAPEPSALALTGYLARNTNASAMYNKSGMLYNGYTSATGDSGWSWFIPEGKVSLISWVELRNPYDTTVQFRESKESDKGDTSKKQQIPKEPTDTSSSVNKSEKSNEEITAKIEENLPSREAPPASDTKKPTQKEDVGNGVTPQSE
jgi:hypothetical protein